MITLYPRQEKLVNRIRVAISKGHKKIIAQYPTGGGKTVMFSYIAIHAAMKENKILIITDRDELLKQAGGTVRKLGLNPSFIRAGAKYVDDRKKMFIAMSQTLRNRIEKKDWKDFITDQVDIVIIDEAHKQEFNYLYESGILKNKLVLAFTATPSRSGKMRQLGLDYEVLIRGGEPRDLIEDGHLLNCDLYNAEAPDMKGVKINASTNDFNEQSMFQRFDSPTIYKGLISNYKEKAEGKKMIVFCCNIEHSIKTTLELVKAGYRAKFVASEPSKPKQKENPTNAEKAIYNERVRRYDFFIEHYMNHSGTRKQMIDGFANNDFEILVNTDILTTGYDESTIEVVAINRATKSLTLWLQMLGRGSRLCEKIGKSHFIALDFGGNSERHGGYEVNRNWSLWHEEKKEGGVAPVKECGHSSKGKPLKSSNHIEKGCRRLILASYIICPFCGFKYPEKDEGKEVDLTLQKVTTDEGVIISSKSVSSMNWEELTNYREAKKHKFVWLWRQLWMRGKEKELKNYAAAFNWSSKSLETALNYCKNNFN